MRLTFSDQQNALRCQIRDFLEEEWTEEAQRRAEEAGEIASGHSASFHEKLAKKGWLALDWPQEYGGKGWSPVDMAILHEELGYYGIPTALSVTSVVANAIIHMGSEEQKKKYLPELAAGRLLFSLGYTEPNAGSDLASLETRAIEDGDDYLISGVKVFNSGGHVADYCWLAARTDPQAPKHKGISVFIVNLKSHGVTIRPLYNVADGHQQNELVFREVRVPKAEMVGDKNRGWYVIAKALDIERIHSKIIGEQRRALDELTQYCTETDRNGAPLSKDPVVRQKLVELHAESEVARLLAYRVVWLQSEGEIPDVAASMALLYAGQLSQKIAHVGIELLGIRGIIHGSSKWAAMKGHLEYLVRRSMPATVAGGSAEMQREVIAHRGLGLPKD